MSDIEANRKLVRRFLEASSNGDVDLWASMMADDGSYEVMGNSVMSGLWSKAKIVEALRGFAQVFPKGIRVTVPSAARGSQPQNRR